jgi:DNA-binding NarL/FixJ family response regulator
MQEVTILIVDDHPVFRRGLYDVIGRDSRFRIVGEASDGDEALRMVINLRPHIAIIDIDMPRLNGLETVRSLRKLALSVTAVFLTMYKEEDMFNAAMDLGAKAYVLKENAANDILIALDRVTQGDTFVSPLMLDAGQRRVDRVQQLLLSKPQIEDLTPTERRILKLVGEDHTSKEIAEFLKISVRTVENHRQNICKKLNLHGTHSLLKFAFDNSAYL